MLWDVELGFKVQLYPCLLGLVKYLNRILVPYYHFCSQQSYRKLGHHTLTEIGQGQMLLAAQELVPSQVL